MTTTVACGNQKGGVGKTTTAINLAAYFARRGRRCLVVDLDSQGNVSESFGVSSESGLYRLVCDKEPVNRVVTNVRPNLDIISNDHKAEKVKTEAMQSNFRAYILHKALASADDYDLVFLDMPPSSDLLHQAALVASDYFIVPAIMDHLALIGVMEIINSARSVGEYPGVTSPSLVGILPTMFDRRTKETQENISRLGKALNDMSLILPPIPDDVKVREASSYGKTIWEYAPKSAAAIGYPNGLRVKNSCGNVGGYLHLAEIMETII